MLNTLAQANVKKSSMNKKLMEEVIVILWRALRIALFLLLFFALSPESDIYYKIMNFTCMFGFAALAYRSFRKDRISSFAYGTVAGAFGVYVEKNESFFGPSSEGWHTFYAVSLTVLGICSFYDMLDTAKKM